MANAPTFTSTNTVSKRTFEDDLTEEILSALRGTGYLELYDVSVSVDGHDVLLFGCLPSYFLKQKAEYTTRSIPGVASLKSDIQVTRGCSSRTVQNSTTSVSLL